MGRALSVFVQMMLISAALSLVLFGVVQGQVSSGVAVALAVVVLRQELLLLLTRQAFTLDGRPLPALLYLFPAPPAGPDGRCSPYGLAALVMVVGLGFYTGYSLGGGPVVALRVLSAATLLKAASLGLLVGVQFAGLISFTENRDSFPRYIEPWLTYAMFVTVLILPTPLYAVRSPALYHTGYVPLWQVRFAGCEGVQDNRSHDLVVRFASRDAEVTFTRSGRLSMTVDFESIEVELAEGSDVDALEIGLTPASEGRKAAEATHYVSLRELPAEPVSDAVRITIPASGFELTGTSAADLRLRAGGERLPCTMRLRRLALSPGAGAPQ